jgi:hypothetical protein
MAITKESLYGGVTLTFVGDADKASLYGSINLTYGALVTKESLYGGVTLTLVGDADKASLYGSIDTILPLEYKICRTLAGVEAEPETP